MCTDGRTIVALAACALMAFACSDDAVAPPHPVLAVASGDAQRALAGSMLPEEIVVELLDGRNQPLSGVRVTWRAGSGLDDEITPDGETTNELGRAGAHWRLDTSAGNHTLVVRASNGATVTASAVALDRPPADVHAMPMSTYEGSGQLVHPDFVRLPDAWSGDALRLVATPYPAGDASRENPSLYAGTDGTDWRVPLGIENPLEKPTRGSYLSDPDVVYDPDAGEMRIYYRRVTTENEIWMIRSANGSSWSDPVLTVHAINHLIISPSIVRRGTGDWMMWSVNSGTMGCGGRSTTVELRRSADGIAWSDPETVSLSDPDGFAWHIDVEWIPSRSEYWAMYPLKRPGSCTTDRLRLATSADGVHWHGFPSPVLLKGASEELSDVIYRSSFNYDASSGIVTLWYSGAKQSGGVYTWHLAWERVAETALFARVNHPPITELRTQPAETNVPQLTNETAP